MISIILVFIGTIVLTILILASIHAERQLKKWMQIIFLNDTSTREDLEDETSIYINSAWK